MTVIDLNPLKEPKPLTIELGECVIEITQKQLYEASKQVTADYEEDKEGYMEQIRLLYSEALSTHGKIVNDKKKPKNGFKLNDYMADVLWTYVMGYVDGLFKKKLNQE